MGNWNIFSHIPFFSFYQRNIYVQKAAINSAAINMTIAEITHNQIMTQGKTALLEFWMGPDPVRYY